MVNAWTSKYIGKEQSSGSGISDWKKLRESYKPESISLLLVGEAPPEPSSGRFFYEGSPLTDCTQKAFQRAFPEIPDAVNHGCFLKQFKALGCYFDDLSLEPINKRDTFQRNYRLLQHLPKFIQRLKDSPPKTVVVAMKRIDYFVKYGLDEAGLGSLKVSYLQYPSRSKKSIHEYVINLSKIVSVERQQGIFPEIEFSEYGVFDAGIEKRCVERKMADRSHRVEIKLPGIPAYQFKVKDLSFEGASVVIREDSGLVPYLQVGQELEFSYYAQNKRNPDVSAKALIKHMTKAEIAPFQGHFLVGFAISHNGGKRQAGHSVMKA